MIIKKSFPEIFIFTLTIIISIVTINYQPLTSVNKQSIYKSGAGFGTSTDSLSILRDTIKKGDNLSKILAPWGISDSIITILKTKSEGVFDIKKLKSGKPYTIIYSGENLPKALYMIYEDSYTSYVVFVLTDSIHVHCGKKDVDTKIKQTSGIITSSLWDAIESTEAGIDIALLLSDIYECNVDFYELNKGDWFKAIYEELSIDGQVISIGRILAATFCTNNNEYNAFWFAKDSAGEYFDETGLSLKREFLKAPLEFTRISSRFSYSRMHPILKYKRPHLGLDYSAPYGTPVKAVGSGIIEKAGYNGQSGKMVKINHRGGYSTAYLHLSSLGASIRPGAYVKQGQTIGYVGSSGLSTGAHLDFRFYKNNRAIDPLQVESPPEKPVDSLLMPRFNKETQTLLEQLKKIEIKGKI